MKKILLLASLLLTIGCKPTFSQEIKEQIKAQESFWKNRNHMNTKNDPQKIFPIAKNTRTINIRTNRIYLRSMKCQFEVFVNDVLLFKTMGEITKNGGGITGSYDINQLMLTSGTHEVKVRMYPMYDLQLFDQYTPYMDLTFSYFKDRDLKTTKYNKKMNGHNGIELSQSNQQWITKYNEEHQEEYDGDYEPKTPINFEGLPMYEWRSTFDAEVDFDLVGWRESVNLKKENKDQEDKLKNKLIQAYKNIHQLIKNKDIKGYLALVKEREELITTSLHYKENEKPLREQEFTKLLESNEYEVEPLFEEVIQLEFQAYGKLVMLLHKADGEGIIRLRNKKDPKDRIYLDFRFQRKKKNEPLSVI